MVTTNRRYRLLCLAGGLVFGSLLMGSNPLEAQGDCKVVLEAANKTQTAATHTYTTMNVAGTTQTVEIIFLPGVMYPDERKMESQPNDAAGSGGDAAAQGVHRHGDLQVFKRRSGKRGNGDAIQCA